jgi:hypothetical protein
MPVDRNELEIFAARFVLDRMNRHEIYSLADRLTSEEDDDQALIDILIEGETATKEEVRPLFREFLSGRGIAFPTRENSVVDLAYRYAKRASMGLIDYVRAVHLIDALESIGH